MELRKEFQLREKLKSTEGERNYFKVKDYYHKWALQDLTNGHDHLVTQLYKAGELQGCIPYYERDQLGTMIHYAAKDMKQERKRLLQR